jgi:hypothetical protein
MIKAVITSTEIISNTKLSLATHIVSNPTSNPLIQLNLNYDSWGMNPNAVTAYLGRRI